MADPHAKQDLFEQFARVGKALASSKRLELLDLLGQSERRVEALADAAGLGLTSCSAHLQALKQAGLVRTRREGARVYYRLAGADVAELLHLVRGVAIRQLPDAVAARDAYLGGDDTQAVDRDELLRRLETGGVLLIDVRPPEEFAAGHIPGAVSAPLAQLSTVVPTLPEDVPIVAYCRGAYCVMAHEAVRRLAAEGRAAARLTDGMLEWRLAGLPVEPAA